MLPSEGVLNVRRGTREGSKSRETGLGEEAEISRLRQGSGKPKAVKVAELGFVCSMEHDCPTGKCVPPSTSQATRARISLRGSSSDTKNNDISRPPQPMMATSTTDAAPSRGLSTRPTNIPNIPSTPNTLNTPNTHEPITHKPREPESVGGWFLRMDCTEARGNEGQRKTKKENKGGGGAPQQEL